MSKFNWTRIRGENLVSQHGTENAYSEFVNDPPLSTEESLPQKKQFQKCPYCHAKLGYKKRNLKRHIKKCHPGKSLTNPKTLSLKCDKCENILRFHPDTISRHMKETHNLEENWEYIIEFMYNGLMKWRKETEPSSAPIPNKAQK